MRIALLGYKGEFSSYNKTDSRFYRYAYQLYSNMKRNRYKIDVNAIEARYLSFAGKGPSIFAETFLKKFGDFDILHNLDLAPLFPLRKGNCTFVTTAHDFQPLLAPEMNITSGNLNIKDWLWLNFVVRVGYKSMLSSDFLIAVSTLTKSDAIKLGFDRNKIFVVNHGVDKRFSAPIKKTEKKKFRIGYVGVFAPRKNVNFAINAIKKIDDDNLEFELWGNKSYDYEKLVNISKNDKRIRFMGFAPENEIVKIYDSFDLFVQPSMYEGFSIPIIEAQARGLPVVIYKNGKLPKETKRYCLQARDEEHMAQIIQDIKNNGYNDKRRMLAMKYARSFTWEKCANQTLKAYMKMR